MNLSTIKYIKNKGIAKIIFNRPNVLNAINKQLLEEFLKVLEDCKKDYGIRVVLIMGEGRAFCVGDDLKEETDEISFESGAERLQNLQETTRLMTSMDKPVIAVIQGYAVGAGLEWSLNCDIRIAAEGTKFGFPETSVGMTITNAGTWFLPRLIGLARAKEMVFFGEKIDAIKALEWGLINRVLPLEQLEKEADVLANKILEKSRMAISLSKKSLNLGAALDMESAMANETSDIGLIAQSYETRIRINKQLTQD